jgi:hypothetical protein
MGLEVISYRMPRPWLRELPGGHELPGALQTDISTGAGPCKVLSLFEDPQDSYQY